jgi:hypothetical protein
MTNDVDNQKIILITPYFGKWPCWFDFFIESCKYNPKINWLFYTDCGEPNNHAPNVKIVHCSFDDYKKRVADTLGITFNPESPFKLCDIKPAYGFIHQQEITEYDFWGFGDIDVIYGDLQGYITSEMLQHNMISFHGHRVAGHLCLLRNNEQMRNAFKKAKDWRAIFEDKSNRAFDERQFNALFIRHKNWPEKIRRFIYFSHFLMRTAYFKEAYSTSFGSVAWIDGSFNFPEEWCWQKGVLTTPISGDKQFPYVHFLHWKKHWPTDMPIQASINDDIWYIRKNGIFNE